MPAMVLLSQASVTLTLCRSPHYRLVEDEERRWTDENIDMVALKHFPNIDKEKAMSRPILYSNWLSKVTCLERLARLLPYFSELTASLQLSSHPACLGLCFQQDH